MTGRLATLLWWLTLWCIPGGLRWRYWRGGWLGEFNRCRSDGVLTAQDVEDFEYDRQIMSARHREWVGATRIPSGPAEAERLWAEFPSLNHTWSFIGRRELHPLRFLRLMRWLPWIGGRILEFGAGAAPLAHGVTKAWPGPIPRIDVADIDWPLRDYCERRFAALWPRIAVCAVTQIPDRIKHYGPYDAIVCLETLEHVPDPPETADRLVRWLAEGGVLLWDYCEQEKDQPLAPRGKSGRDATIALLEKRLDLIHGPDARGLRVSRKRQTHVREG